MCRAAVVTPSRSVASASPKQRLGKGTSLLVPYQRPIGNAASAAEVRRCFISARRSSRNPARAAPGMIQETRKERRRPWNPTR